MQFLSSETVLGQIKSKLNVTLFGTFFMARNYCIYYLYEHVLHLNEVKWILSKQRPREGNFKCYEKYFLRTQKIKIESVV